MRKSVIAALTVAGLLAGIPAVRGATPLEPQQDPFYTPPAGLAADAPGAVLASRPVSVAVYGRTAEAVRAWQVLYRTTDTQGDPEATVATIVEPEAAPPAGGRPLVSYQVAEDSLGEQCAPSYELQEGAASTNSVEQTEIFLIDGLLEEGWAVVVPDYEGPQSAYGAGVQAGHAVLDGIRAAESFGPAGLDGPATPLGMWGYSGGALATAWASELQPAYAPGLDVRGVAEGGVPVNLGNIAERINGGPFAGYYLAGVVGLGRAYPQLAALLQQILTPQGQAAAAAVGTECNSSIVQNYAFKNITSYTTSSDPLTLPAARQVLAADSLGQARPTGPLYVYQAVGDELIPIADVDGLVARYCAEGVPVTYSRNLASEHLTLVGTGAPAALAWLQDRLDGSGPAPSGCSTTTVASNVLSGPALVALVRYLSGLAPLFGS
jgi:hypothetical protein